MKLNYWHTTVLDEVSLLSPRESGWHGSLSEGAGANFLWQPSDPLSVCCYGSDVDLTNRKLKANKKPILFSERFNVI